MPELHRREHQLDRDTHGRRHARPGHEDVVARDGDRAVADAGLHAVEGEVELVAHLEQAGAVAGDLLGELPLAEDAQDLHLALVTAREEGLLVDGEGDVTVLVDVGLELEVLEDVEDLPAQGVLVGGRREVGQSGWIGHGSTVTTG